MIILRVAMGRGWRKETINELNTALVFANSAPVNEQNQAVAMEVHITRDPPSRESSIKSGSLKEPMSGSGLVSLV
jgi:hypothetical protein